jgi:hypothetical protein
LVWSRRLIASIRTAITEGKQVQQAYPAALPQCYPTLMTPQPRRTAPTPLSSSQSLPAPLRL